MSEVFKGILETLGYRFFLASLAPALGLAAGLVTLAVLFPDPTLATWPAWWPGHLDALIGSTPFWILVILLALVSIAFNRPVIQLFEGYPLFHLRNWLRRSSAPSELDEWPEKVQAAGGEERVALIASQDRGAKNLEGLRRGVIHHLRAAQLEPPVDKALPTRLGRILRRMELEPLQRYGIDAMGLWSRFQLVIPAAVADQYRIGKTWLDFTLNFATTALLLAFGSGVLAWRSGELAAWIVPVACLLFTYLLYRAALTPARTMSLAFETAFDLYRAPMLELWGLEPPVHLAEERQLWLHLGAFRRYCDPYLFPEERRRQKEAPEGDAEPSEPSVPRRIVKRRRPGQ